MCQGHPPCPIRLALENGEQGAHPSQASSHEQNQDKHGDCCLESERQRERDVHGDEDKDTETEHALHAAGNWSLGVHRASTGAETGAPAMTAASRLG